MRHWIWCDIDQRIPILTSALPRSILVLSGRYHIISNASLVNNCILYSLGTLTSCLDHIGYGGKLSQQQSISENISTVYPYCTNGFLILVDIHWNANILGYFGSTVKDRGMTGQIHKLRYDKSWSSHATNQTPMLIYAELPNCIFMLYSIMKLLSFT